MPTPLLRAVRSLGDTFRDAVGLFDLFMTAIVLSVAMWFFWDPYFCYYDISRDMGEFLPSTGWGFVAVIIGVTLFFSIIYRSVQWLAVGYMVLFAWWLFLGWVFCVRPAKPPTLGILSPVFAVFSFYRLMLIPPPPKYFRHDYSLRSERGSPHDREEGRIEGYIDESLTSSKKEDNETYHDGSI